MEKSRVLIKFLLNFRQSGDVLFFLNVRRLRGYTATICVSKMNMNGFVFFFKSKQGYALEFVSWTPQKFKQIPQKGLTQNGSVLQIA